jgi:hypothetical protein
MKKTILILLSIAFGVLVFLVGAYFIAVSTIKKSEPQVASEQTGSFVTNPQSGGGGTSTTTVITTPGTIVYPSSTGTSTVQNPITISASIVVQSGPATFIVENVSQADGTVIVGFKIITNASGNVAVDPGQFLKIIDLSGGVTAPRVLQGDDFRNIPPNSEIFGNAIFFLSKDKPSVILQVGPDSSARYYEFDFIRRVYRSVTVG